MSNLAQRSAGHRSLRRPATVSIAGRLWLIFLFETLTWPSLSNGNCLRESPQVYTDVLPTTSTIFISPLPRSIATLPSESLLTNKRKRNCTANCSVNVLAQPWMTIIFPSKGKLFLYFKPFFENQSELGR